MVTLLLLPGAIAASAHTGGVAPRSTCLPALSKCLRGSGSLERFDPEDPPSLSTAACCAACTARTGCQGWQLYATGSSQQACWLQPSFTIKPGHSDGVNCTAGAIATPPNPARANHSGYAGIWVQHGDTQDLLNQSFVLGGDTTVNWADVEIADDVWDWTSTDLAFARQAAAGFYIETALQVGPMAPTWLYKSKEQGGAGLTPTLVVMSNSGIRGQCIKNKTYPSYLCEFPPYLDQRYQAYFLRAIDRFAEHIATLPNYVKSKIIASQAMYGSTGDDCPWHGTPIDPEKEICFGNKCPTVGKYEDEWHNFTMSTAPAICAFYAKRNIRVLWNTNVSRLEELVEQCPGSFIKAGMVTHGFGVNDEADNYEGKGRICHTEGYSCRGESWPFCQHGYYTEAPLWATYSHLLWLLTFGVDLPGLSEPNLVNESYAPLYSHTFNRYAGSIRPPADNWVGGIVALRDGLDAANFSRFPKSQFGTWDRPAEKIARLQKIAAAFAKRGAVERDPVAATMSAMGSRHRNGTNDVGYRIWQGNYGNGLITQLFPFETSIGYWGIGPLDQPYGRYARGFESATGRTDMAFVLDKRLWRGLPMASSDQKPNLTLAVTYLDRSDDFDIYVDTSAQTAGCGTPARSVHGTGTDRWITVEFSIDDGYFGRRCQSKVGGADIILRSKSLRRSQGAIVHSLEMYDPSKLP